MHDIVYSASDMGVMIALFKLQDDFVRKTGDCWGWFFATNQRISQISKRSKATVKRARLRLMRFGLIKYRCGRWSERKATEYRILIDPFYLADAAIGRGSTEPDTKAISKSNQQ